MIPVAGAAGIVGSHLVRKIELIGLDTLVVPVEQGHHVPAGPDVPDWAGHWPNPTGRGGVSVCQLG
ncbi:hypothetical protein GCM10022419_031780 [Nonomuraea rosea]|uniref:NAD-dependent epimerase/dehydratase family protein n=1 Tax=Nonomuraea rosea TaxID=638574 RepID=A0ABP6WFK0_9ACTN